MTTLPADCCLRDLEPHRDGRGDYTEVFRDDWFPGLLSARQVNLSRRREGVLVGLHYHFRQVECWVLASGRARVVLHDIRRGSPTEGATWSADLDAAKPRALHFPAGVAHGFFAMTDVVLLYATDRRHEPGDERGIAWDDPEVAAPWGFRPEYRPILSERDQRNPRLRDIADGPRYSGDK